MKRFLVATIATGALLASGCATKKYVRNTTTPIQAKVDQVGEQTAKHAQQIQENQSTIKQVDEKAQSGISAAQERAGAAQKGADEAMNRANQAGTQAAQANEGVNRNSEALNNLRQVVSNLDDYKMQTEVTVPFKFNKYQLTPQAKQDLDGLANNLNANKRYFLAVEGFTDKTGTNNYNDALSRRRADAVVQYLVAQHDVPIYRIHMIGLGSQKPAEEGRTRAARAKNRRVEVKLFTVDNLAAQSGANNASSGNNANRSSDSATPAQNPSQSSDNATPAQNPPMSQH